MLRKSGPARALDPNHRPESIVGSGNENAPRDKVDVDTFHKGIQYRNNIHTAVTNMTKQRML